MEILERPKEQEYATKLTLIGIFLSLFTAFVSSLSIGGKKKQEFSLQPFDLLLLVLSTFRLGRMVSYDQIAEPLRAPFTKTVPDSTGAGKTVTPRGEGARLAVGQLVSCPICSGTWIAAGLVYGLYTLPSPTRAFLGIMSAIGGAELLNSLNEALSWAGQAARQFSGSGENGK